MNIGPSSFTPPIIDVMVAGPRFPDPLDDIRDLLPKVGSALGCPECCSATDPWFYLKSSEWGEGVPIAQGFTPLRLTKIDDDWTLAEGQSSVIIAGLKTVSGETVETKPIQLKAAVLLGSKQVMRDMSALQAGLKAVGDTPRWKEMSRSFDVIGFAELPQVLRTNDPLIT